MPGVLLLTDPAMAAHASPGHPERPARLGAAAAGVEAGAHLVGADLQLAEITPANDEALLRIHTAAHIARLASIVAAGGGWLDADTYVGPESMRAARLAAGGT
ncbi:MAG: histone deacetylase, partial [Chloroflexota bacterium]|nr:histone deacetylase [Chloroflexota bacterium]